MPLKPGSRFDPATRPPPPAMGVSETILGFLAEPLGTLQFVVVYAPVTAIISEIGLRFLKAWVKAKD